MTRAEENVEKAKCLTGDLDRVRNIAVAAHIDHGKTLVSERLMQGAGLQSEASIAARKKGGKR